MRTIIITLDIFTWKYDAWRLVCIELIWVQGNVLKEGVLSFRKKQGNSFYHDSNRAYLNFHSPKRIRMHMRKYYIIVA